MKHVVAVHLLKNELHLSLSDRPQSIWIMDRQEKLSN